MYLRVPVLISTLLCLINCFSFKPKVPIVQRRGLEDYKDKSSSVLSLPSTSSVTLPRVPISVLPKDASPTIIPFSRNLDDKDKDPISTSSSPLPDKDRASALPSKDHFYGPENPSGKPTSTDSKPSVHTSSSPDYDKDKTQPIPRSSDVGDKNSLPSPKSERVTPTVFNDKDTDKTTSSQVTSSIDILPVGTAKDKDQDKDAFGITSSMDTVASRPTLPSKDILPGKTSVSLPITTLNPPPSSTPTPKERISSQKDIDDKDKSSSPTMESPTFSSAFSTSGVPNTSKSSKIAENTSSDIRSTASGPTADFASQSSRLTSKLRTRPSSSLQPSTAPSSSRPSVQTDLSAHLSPSPSSLVTTRILNLTAPTRKMVPSSTGSLSLTSEPPFLNASSSVVPLWTPTMLGNAYGGGYITTPSIYVTLAPTPSGSIHGIPPGYGSSSLLSGSISGSGFAHSIVAANRPSNSSISVSSVQAKDQGSHQTAAIPVSDKEKISIGTPAISQSQKSSNDSDKLTLKGNSSLSNTQSFINIMSTTASTAEINANSTSHVRGSGPDIDTATGSSTMLLSPSIKPSSVHIPSERLPIASTIKSLSSTATIGRAGSSVVTSASTTPGILRSRTAPSSASPITTSSSMILATDVVNTDTNTITAGRDVISPHEQGLKSSTAVRAMTVPTLSHAANPGTSLTVDSSGPISTTVGAETSKSTISRSDNLVTIVKSAASDQSAQVIFSTFQSPRESGQLTKEIPTEASPLSILSGPVGESSRRTLAAPITDSTLGAGLSLISATVSSSDSSRQSRIRLSGSMPASDTIRSSKIPANPSGTSSSFVAGIIPSCPIQANPSCSYLCSSKDPPYIFCSPEDITVSAATSCSKCPQLAAAGTPISSLTPGATTRFSLPTPAGSSSFGSAQLSILSGQNESSSEPSTFPRSCPFVSASACPTPADSCCSYRCGAALVPFEFCSPTDGTGQFQLCSKCPDTVPTSATQMAPSSKSPSPTVAAVLNGPLSESSAAQSSLPLQSLIEPGNESSAITSRATIFTSTLTCPDQSSFRVNCPATFNPCCSWVCGGKALPFGSSICLRKSGIAPVETCLQCLNSPATSTESGFDTAISLPRGQASVQPTRTGSVGPSSVVFVDGNGSTLTTAATEIPSIASIDGKSLSAGPSTASRSTPASVEVGLSGSEGLEVPSTIIAGSFSGSKGQTVTHLTGGLTDLPIAGDVGTKSPKSEAVNEVPNLGASRTKGILTSMTESAAGGSTQAAFSSINIPTLVGPAESGSNGLSDAVQSSFLSTAMSSPGSISGEKAGSIPNTISTFIGSSVAEFPYSQTSSTDTSISSADATQAETTSLPVDQPLVPTFSSGGVSYGNSTVPFRPIPVPIQEFTGSTARQQPAFLSIMLFIAAVILLI